MKNQATGDSRFAWFFMHGVNLFDVGFRQKV
jgi:hypothetical protein